MLDTESLEFVLSMIVIPFNIVGFIGNVLVIHIVRKTQEMHTTTNYLLVNLAISDVITIVLGPLYFFSHLYGYLSDGFGQFVCKFVPLTNIAVAVSSFSLTVLAVERYHALLKPLRTGLRLTEDNIKEAIALIWILSVIFGFPCFFFQEWSETYVTCIGPLSLHMNQASKVYLIIVAVFVTYIPMTVMLYCYGAMIRGLYFTNTVCPENDGERSEEKKKLVGTFIMATAGFMIGYAPFVVFYTFIASGGDEQIGVKLYSDISSVFSAFLLNCSLCLNPILYAFRSTNFQEGFKRIILCRRSIQPN